MTIRTEGMAVLETASASMANIDQLINKYAPIDLATAKLPDSVMCVDLRNMRHHAFSILCELQNLTSRYNHLYAQMEEMREFAAIAKRIQEIYNGRK